MSDLQPVSSTLSNRDASVLEYLFNPLIQSPCQADAHRTEESEENEGKEGDTENIAPAVIEEVKKMEAKGVVAARTLRYEEALGFFADAIQLAPHYSSPYNNRAQVYRILKKYQEAKEDLDRAIQYSHPDKEEEPQNKRVAKLAYAQRGFLLKGFMDKEEEGQQDLEKAASMGHSLAALETNPFRTMCGDMVSIMMKEQCGLDV